MVFHSETVTHKKGNKMTKHYIRGDVIWLNYYVDGVRKQKSTKLKNTPQNIKIVMSKIIPALDIKIATGEIYKKKPKTFEYYGGIFLKQKSEDKNYFQMKSFYNRILKHFKGINIDEITRLDIKKYFMSLKFNSVNPYKVVFKSVFELAVDDGVIQTNPSINIKTKSIPKKDIEYFTKVEVNKILSVIPDGRFKTYLLIAFNTGMRTGEILGLQLGDFEEKYISIKRSRTQGVIGKGKTSNAIRKIPYPSFLLDEVKKIQKNNIFIFGNYDDAGKLRYLWEKYLTIAKIKKRRLYSTRHTYATLMLQDKVVSINVLAGLLGHNSTKTTLDKYASVINPDTVDLGSDFSLFCDTTVTVENNGYRKAL